jgi:5-formyltetrahydrofolate cyclo-ligase
LKEQKAAARAAIKARRESAGAAAALKDAAVFEKLVRLDAFAGADLVLTYISGRFEADTRRLIDHCLRVGKPVAAPVAFPGGEMTFYAIGSPDDIIPGARGFCEPVRVRPVSATARTLCVVPALAFNGENYRLGYGGGYYDRYLSGFGGFSAGLCHNEFILDIPVGDNDIRVDLVISD